MSPSTGKIVTWNCNGLKANAASTKEKLGFFDKEFPNGLFSIAVFIESHHRNIDDIPLALREYDSTHNLFHTPAPPGHSHRGIIVLISKAYTVLSWREVIPGRLINIKYFDQGEGKEFNFSAFYGPVQRDLKCADVEGLIKHFHDLHAVSDNNIILGDFNFIDNHLDKSKGLESHDKMIGRFWEIFKRAKRVSDPYREHFPSTKTFSYHSKNGKSRGDRVYVSKDSTHTILKQIRINFYLLYLLLSKKKDLAIGN